jgi:RNA polymerase sigma-70 factor (ECF subfamily)
MIGENHSAFSNLHTMGQYSEIVSAAQAGSREAFAELHALYSRRLYRTIIAITRNSADAEDALQETFLRVYSAIHTFEGRSNIYSWLTRIAINSALMVLRRQRARTEILFDPQPDTGSESCPFEFKDSAPNPEQVCDLEQRRVNLLHAICNLNDHLRTPLQLRMTKESPIKEIGRALNISEAAVKTRLHRARRQLSMHVRRWDE